MKKNIIIKINIAIISLFLPFIVSSQILPKRYEIRSVQVTQDDTIQVAEVMHRVKRAKKQTCSSCMYAWYSANQIMFNQGFYNENPLHGKYLKKNLQKQILVAGEYNKGLKHGAWKYWNNKGELLYTQEWKQGVLEGTVYIYTDTKLTESIQYVNNKKQGKHITYINGVAATIVEYNKGEIKPEKEPKKSKEKGKLLFQNKSQSPEYKDLKKAGDEDKTFVATIKKTSLNIWLKTKSIFSAKADKEQE